MKIFVVIYILLLFVLICLNNETQGEIDGGLSKVTEIEKKASESGFNEQTTNEVVYASSTDTAESSSAVVVEVEPEYIEYIAVVSTPKGLCSASIIFLNWIITAAHCIVGYNKNDIKIHFRVTNIEYDNDYMVEVDKVFIHPFYRKGSFRNDICMIRLVRPVMLSKNLQTIEIDNYPLLENTTLQCSAAGYYDGKSLKVNASVVRGEETCPCLIDRDFICINETPVNNRYIEDTGGPLICDNKLVAIRFGLYDNSMCEIVANEIVTLGVAKGLNTSIVTQDLETLIVTESLEISDVNGTESYNPSRYYTEIKTYKRNVNNLINRRKKFREVYLKRELNALDEGFQNTTKPVTKQHTNNTVAGLVVYIYLYNHDAWINDVLNIDYPNPDDFPVGNFLDDNGTSYLLTSKAKKVQCYLKFSFGLQLLVSLLYFQ